MRGLKARRVFCMLMALAMCLGAGAAGGAEAGAALYEAGTYDGVGQGRNGEVRVQVTFTDTAIELVEVTEHQETPGFADTPIENIPRDVVAYQSLGVDVVSSATLTSQAILDAVADAVIQAGGDADAMKAVPVDKAEPGELVSLSADVIVVGGGGAGIAAAYAAAEAGATVIVVEKTPVLGGNTLRSGGYANAVIPENQKNQEMTEGQIATVETIAAMEPRNEIMNGWIRNLEDEWEAYKASGETYLFDSIYLHMLQSYIGGDYVGNPELIESMCAAAPETYAWLAEKGFDWKENSIIIVGALWPRANMSKTYKSGIGFIDVLREDAEQAGLPIAYQYGVAGEELIMEGGRCVGLKGTASDGTPYAFHAGKGVVIATGGFGANVEMRVQYNEFWADLGPGVPTTNSPAITGDGILMAEAAGASLTGMGDIQMLIADPVTGETSTTVGDTTSIYLNKEGLRYVNETERRDVLCGETLKQTDGMMYIISSYQNSRLDENMVNTYGIHLDDLVERGAVFTADTIEALAEQIDVDPAVLRKTVDDYNAAIDAGQDELTGRTIFNTTAKIEETGPYFANPRSPAVHHTMGGIEVDVHQHVLDTDGNPILGLYAAGEVTGGFHGANRLGGNAISECLSTGRIAGATVVEENP